MQALQKLENAARMLAEIRDASDAKAVMDMAGSVENYAKRRHLGAESINHAHAIMIDAQAMLGGFLKAGPTNVGAKGSIVTGTKRVPVKDTATTLAQLGLTKKESSASKFLRELADKNPAEYQTIRGNEKTISGIRRLWKERKRQKIREANRKLVESTAPIELNGERYQTIVLDPPWDWGDEGDHDQLGRARPTYDTMSLAEIADPEKMPVAELAAENAHLYLWITNRSLPKGFGLIEKWGFRYVTMLTWVKPSFGMGNYFRGSTEHVLFGVKGSLPLLRNDVPTHLQAQRPGEHSGKPPEFYALVEMCSPGPWLEFFARKQRPGWVTWGAEAQCNHAAILTSA